MKISINITILLIAFLLLENACDSQTKTIEKTKEKTYTTIQTHKTDYESAYGFLNNLKSNKTDTIIFYKRTCTNHFDFFYIFWVSKRQRNLTKFYFDAANKQTHIKTIKLTNSKIFEGLSKYYNELKNSSIKENAHINKDGTSSTTISSHDCYTHIRIYAKRDSIITSIKDHDFDEYTDFRTTPSDKKEARQKNDHYQENINSKWNLWLKIIENEISNMLAIIKQEKNALRTRK